MTPRRSTRAAGRRLSEICDYKINAEARRAEFSFADPTPRLRASAFVFEPAAARLSRGAGLGFEAGGAEAVGDGGGDEDQRAAAQQVPTQTLAEDHGAEEDGQGGVHQRDRADGG